MPNAEYECRYFIGKRMHIYHTNTHADEYENVYIIKLLYDMDISRFSHTHTCYITLIKHISCFNCCCSNIFAIMGGWLAIHFSLGLLTFCVNLYSFLSFTFPPPPVIYARRQHFHHFRCQHLPFRCSLAMNVYFLSFSVYNLPSTYFFIVSFTTHSPFCSLIPIHCVCVCARWIFELCTVFGFIDLRAYTRTRTMCKNVRGSFKRLRKVLDTILYLHPIDDLKQFNRSWKPEDFTQEINDNMTSCVSVCWFVSLFILYTLSPSSLTFAFNQSPIDAKPKEIPFV